MQAAHITSSICTTQGHEAVQVSAMKSSLSEMGSKLVASHSQQCEAAARSEATICALNEKFGKASGELAVLRSAVEAAALEHERAEGQMKRLQHELDSKTKDLHDVCLPSTCPPGIFGIK